MRSGQSAILSNSGTFPLPFLHALHTQTSFLRLTPAVSPDLKNRIRTLCKIVVVMVEGGLLRASMIEFLDQRCGFEGFLTAP